MHFMIVLSNCCNGVPALFTHFAGFNLYRHMTQSALDYQILGVYVVTCQNISEFMRYTDLHAYAIRGYISHVCVYAQLQARGQCTGAVQTMHIQLSIS